MNWRITDIHFILSGSSINFEQFNDYISVIINIGYKGINFSKSKCDKETVIIITFS